MSPRKPDALLFMLMLHLVQPFIFLAIFLLIAPTNKALHIAFLEPVLVALGLTLGVAAWTIWQVAIKAPRGHGLPNQRDPKLAMGMVAMALAEAPNLFGLALHLTGQVTPGKFVLVGVSMVSLVAMFLRYRATPPGF